MSDKLVRYEVRGAVAILQMDDGKVNALTHPMLEQLQEAFTRARQEAKAVALFGRPGRFSAGFDLKVMMSGPEAMTSLVTAGAEALMTLYEHGQPVVIGCTGHAVAGGVLLAATGDRRIGVRGPFKLGLNELTNRMPVPIFAHELARDRLDPRALTRATLGAQMYDPEGAVQVGWLDELADADDLEAKVIAEAETLAKLSGAAYAMSKASLRRSTIDHVRATLATNIKSFLAG